MPLLWNIFYVLLGTVLGVLLGSLWVAARYVYRIGRWLPKHRTWYVDLNHGTCPACGGSVLKATTATANEAWYKCVLCSTVYLTNDFMWLAKVAGK